MSEEIIQPTPPKELNNLDLLELVCQLHGRSSVYPSKEMHDAYWEARNELKSRLQPLGIDVEAEVKIRVAIHDIVNGVKHPMVVIDELIELFRAGYAASKSSAEEAIGERTFSLKEAFDIYTAGFVDGMNKNGPTINEYFKDKFGIEI